MVAVPKEKMPFEEIKAKQDIYWRGVFQATANRDLDSLRKCYFALKALDNNLRINF